jgi:protein O-mannosyl-transferase
MEVLVPSKKASNAPVPAHHPDPLLTYTLLGLIAALPYLNTILNGFVYDDDQQILSNPFIQNWHYWRQMLTGDVWSFVGPTIHSGYYRPLMNLTFFALWKLYGAVPIGYHIANVILDVLVVCLLFAVTNRWWKDRTGAFLVAAVFALHPIHSETVAWIADITDLEGAFFVLLAFWFYLGVTEQARHRTLRAAGVVTSFALALFSKESMIVFPALLTLFEFCFRDESATTTTETKLKRVMPLWITASIYLVIRALCLGTFSVHDTRTAVSRKETVLTGFSLLAHYAGKLLWPANLCAFYAFPHPQRIFSVPVLVGFVALTGSIATIFAMRRKQPVISFALTWFLIFLSLSLNVHWLGTTDFAERYLFLPSIGFAWIIGLAASAAWRKQWTRPPVAHGILAVAAAVLALACVAQIVVRNRDWRNDETLFTRTLEQQPHAAQIRIGLGALYWGRGNTHAAENEWRLALVDRPQDPMALTNMAMAMIKENDLPDAERNLQLAIQAAPKLSAPYIWLAHLREKQNRPDLAEAAYRRAVELSPLQVGARQELADFYLSEGRLEDAAQQLRHGAESNPNFLFWDQLGDIYIRLGKLSDAKQAFESALRSNSLDSRAHVELGSMYEREGDRADARKEYQAGMQTEPNNPTALAGMARLESQ